jgi:hypothetical protein
MTLPLPTHPARRDAVLFALALALGCGAPTDLDGETPEVIAPPPTRADLAPEVGEPEPIFGDDGSLLESSETINGLVLPRGLESVVDEDRRHVYRTRSSVDLVLRYLGPRLSTADVERSARGAATYRQATATGSTGAEPMDVSVAPTSGGFTRIELTLAPPTILAEPSEEEARRRLEALVTSGE